MNRRPRLLAAAAGCLLLLLAAEWLLPAPASPQWQRPPAIPAARPDANSDAERAQWTATILARPLLAATRRPPAPPPTLADDTLPRLSAIIVIGGSRRAIFAAAGQKPQLVTAGGAIGVYRLKSMTADKVNLLGPDGPITLRPQFATPPQGR